MSTLQVNRSILPPSCRLNFYLLTPAERRALGIRFDAAQCRRDAAAMRAAVHAAIMPGALKRFQAMQDKRATLAKRRKVKRPRLPGALNHCRP